MKEYIEEIEQNIENIRSAIENQGVDIPEDTPLDEYADKIAEIERPAVKIGHDILPFYCYADNEVDVSNKSKPTIEGNPEKATGDVTEYKDGGTQSIPNDNPNKLLYAMFVPIKEEQNSSDDTFAGPKAIRLQGKKGEKGEEGNDGRDGVIAGMVQYLAAHLFKIVRREDVAEELTNTPVLKYDYTRISSEANRHPKPDFLQIQNSSNQYDDILSVVNTTGTWGLNYELPSENPENYAVLKCVANYNSLSEDVVVTDPIMLSGEGVVTGTEYYCVTSDNTEPSEDATGTPNAIPEEFYNAGKHYLGNKTEITYDSGRTVTTHPVMIMSSPKAIKTIECLYGQSSNIATEPEVWDATIPDDFIVLGKKETTNFTIGDPKETITPIAVKGNPGVDILAQVEEEHVEQGTYEHMPSLDRDEYYLKKGIIVGKDLYIWNGSIEPEGTSNFLHTQEDYYGIIIQDAFATKVQADGNEDDDTMPGYIKNRPVNVSERVIENFQDRGNNIEGVSIVDGHAIRFEISPHEEILELSMTLIKDNVNYGEPVSISLSKTKNSNFFGPYPIKLTKYGLSSSSSSMSPFSNVEIQSYEIKVRKIDLTCSSNNLIELVGEHSTLKLAILKESKNLIPGCKYKFGYNNKPYVVEAMANDVLGNTCYQENNTVTVNGDKSLFNCGISIDQASTYGDQVKIDAPHADFTIGYNVLTNKFYNNAPTSFDQADECSNGDATDLISSGLCISGYKDYRGNEGNVYGANTVFANFTVSFDETCFGNKVNLYFDSKADCTVTISNRSINNTIFCCGNTYVYCNNSSCNTINVYNNGEFVMLSYSNGNDVNIQDGIEFACESSVYNTVNALGNNTSKRVELDNTKNNLVMLTVPNKNVYIDESYKSCVILNENAFANSESGVGKVFASKVVTVS